MFDRFFLFSPTRFDNRHQSSSVVVTVLARRSETVSPLKQFPRVSVISIRSAPVMNAMSSGRAARKHHHQQERIEAKRTEVFKKKKFLLFSTVRAKMN